MSCTVGLALAALVFTSYTLLLSGTLGVPGQGDALTRRQHDKLQVWVALGAADVAFCSLGFPRHAWEGLGAGGCWHLGSRVCLLCGRTDISEFQGKGLKFLMGWVLLCPTLVDRPGSVSISRRHFEGSDAFELFGGWFWGCFLFGLVWVGFFFLIPYPWVFKGFGNPLCPA